MFHDPSVQQLFFHAGTKLLVLVALIFLWFTWVRRYLLPFLASRRPLRSGAATSDQPPTIQQSQTSTPPGKPFPFFTLAGCAVLTIAFVYYATFEVAYRRVNKIDNRLVDRRENAANQKEAEAEQIVVPDDQEESLEDQTKRRFDQAKQDNTAGKQRFEQLEPVDE